MNAPARVLALTVLVLAAGFGGFALYRHVALDHHARTSLHTLQVVSPPVPPKAGNPVGTTADAAAEDDAGAPATARPIPAQLPDLRLPDLSGQQKSLRSFLGHPLIVNFWATWCAPCRREIPLLQQLRHEHGADQLEVVGIAVDYQKAVMAYVKKAPIDYPVLVGEQAGLDAVQKFGMEEVLPFSVFVAADGQIVAVKIGELHADEAQFILAAIDHVDEGTQSLPDARQAIAGALKQFAIQRARANVAAG